MTPPNESLTPEDKPTIFEETLAYAAGKIDKLERDLTALRSAADGLEEIITLQKHAAGPHFIRSCGTCDKCGGTTPNGTLRICRKCLAEATDESLRRYAEARKEK